MYLSVKDGRTQCLDIALVVIVLWRPEEREEKKKLRYMETYICV